MTTESLTPREIRSIRRNEAQEDVVIVNWVFLPRQTPCLTVAIPRSLFEGPVRDVREIFAEELRREYNLVANTNHQFQFFKVVEDIKTQETVNADWMNKTELEEIAPASSLEDILSERVLNKKVVHLAIRAEAAQVLDEKRKRDSSEDEDELTHLVKLFRHSVRVAEAAASPLDGAKMANFARQQEAAPLLNGRPFYNCGPPLELYHPAFAKFLRSIMPEAKPDIPPEFLSKVHSFLIVSADIYRDEKELGSILGPFLKDLLGIAKTTVRNRSLCDGQYTFFSRARFLASLLYELKNDIGYGGCCPFTRAGLSYRKYIVDSERRLLLCTSGCPAFLLGIAGPWLCVGGAYFAAEPMAQQFMDMVYIRYDPL